MTFSVSALVDDHTVSATFGSAKEAFAKAVEWHVTGKLADISISDGVRSYTLDEFAAVLASL